MRRRAVLASASLALLGGCARAPTGGQEFAVTDFNVSSEKVAPPNRYYLRITAVYSTDAVEREEGDPVITDVSEIDDPEHRAAVEAVLSEGRVWRGAIPQGLRELTERVDFFTWEAKTDPDDTATHWAITVYRAHPDREPVVEFSAELLEDHVAPDEPGAITFSLSNTGEHTQAVFSGTVPPFSVLWADGPGSDDRALLWREYAAEGCVTFGEMGGEAEMMTCDIGVTTPIQPGETIERRYELRSGFDREAISDNAFDAPGTYTVVETLSYHRHREDLGPRTEVDWSVTFDLEVI